MKRAAPILAMLIAVFLMAAENHSVQPLQVGLTMHEWGTFTSVAGEDGSAVDWDSLACPNDLPAFVNNFGYRGFKWRLMGSVRMETPVMYFYAPRETSVNVSVQFPHGLMTEWYPQAHYTIYKDSSALPATLSGIDPSLRTMTGAIEWRDVKVEPGSAADFPLASGPDRYYAARDTGAAPLNVAGQHEKFLFYRGVGRFPVPLSARVATDGTIAIANQGQGGVPSVILFENRGGKLGYRDAGAVETGVTLTPPSLDGTLQGLEQKLEAALTAQGLFPKEAHAMVRTWSDSWFEEGSRLFYIVPTQMVNALLPVRIEPTPAEMTRVFVGRIELITPATTRAVQQALAKNDGAALDRYGRFLQPILQRMGVKTDVAAHCR